jgi:hypothetical protein
MQYNMGATNSTTTSAVDIANTFVSNIAISVITKNSTTATGSQSVSISCTDAAFAAAVAACSADTQSNNKLVTAIITANPGNLEIVNTALAMNQIEPASCSMCSAENITLDMNVAINTKAIIDNTIASQIKTELSSALQLSLDNATTGGIGMTSSDMNSTAVLKNYVDNNFNTNIVNETLNTFTFSQSINASNAKVSNINMKLVGTALGAAIVKNAIETSADVSAAIATTVTAKAETVGTEFPDLLGGLFGGAFGTIAAIIGGIIGSIMLIVILKILMSGGRAQVAPAQVAPAQVAPAPYPPTPYPTSNEIVSSMYLPMINHPATALGWAM